MSQYTPKTYRYIKWAKEFKAICGPAPTCHICRQTIDSNGAPRNSAGSFTLDHLMPLSRGGDPFDPSNCLPAHRGCNGRRGNRFETDLQPVTPRPKIPARFDDDTPRTSRCWTGCDECREIKREVYSQTPAVGYGNTCPRIIAHKAARKAVLANV